jgi:cysteinyl-tRNA synthetase
MADYGKLARRSLDEMEAGARVEVAPYKRNAMDFVLWKPSKQDEPGWPSPSGIKTLGRPGWHIECSAMSWKHLGESFDIHGGGIDLVFPHHENEIAQTRCAFHSGFMAKTWMHNGFLQVEGEKMSKSLGNFVTIRELLSTNNFGGVKWNGNVLRLAMISTHYRQPIDWTSRGLELAFHTLDDWYVAAGDAKPSTLPAQIVEALCDDLNTSQLVSELHSLRKKVKQPGQGEAAGELAAVLKFVGFDRASFFTSLDEERNKVLSKLSEEEVRVDDLIAARNAARERKDWKESDRIRDELKAMGVVLKDNKDGTTSWEIAR